MSQIPRILPLVAVAVGGVLAVRAIAGLEHAPEFLKSARAMAEEAVKATQKKGDEGVLDAANEAAASKSKSDPKAKPADGAASDGAEAAGEDGAKSATEQGEAVADKAKRPLVCAPGAADLAKEAGLSEAETNLLQSLSKRRGQLDEREKSIDTAQALLESAGTKLDARITKLEAIKSEIQGILEGAKKQLSADKEAEVVRMVKVYEAMKPKDSARVMASLEDSVRLPVAARMKEKSLAAMLAQMTPAEAKDLTEKLAKKNDVAEQAVKRATTNAGLDPASPASPSPRAPKGAAKPAAQPATKAKG